MADRFTVEDANALFALANSVQQPEAGRVRIIARKIFQQAHLSEDGLGPLIGRLLDLGDVGLEAATEIMQLTLRAGQLTSALKVLARNGTHHDTAPTRALAQGDEARKLDDWWADYFRDADRTVRTIAQAALDQVPLAARVVDEAEIAEGLRFLMIENAPGVANQIVNYAVRRRTLGI